MAAKILAREQQSKYFKVAHSKEVAYPTNKTCWISDEFTTNVFDISSLVLGAETAVKSLGPNRTRSSSPTLASGVACQKRAEERSLLSACIFSIRFSQESLQISKAVAWSVKFRSGFSSVTQMF